MIKNFINFMKISLQTKLMDLNFRKRLWDLVVPSGVEPLSKGPEPHRITTTPRDY